MTSRDDILRFVDDLTVPPTSNDAERGLRPSKIQQKISGRLTSIPRTEDRYRDHGLPSRPPRNNGLDQFKTLLDTFRGHVWMPPEPVAVPRCHRNPATVIGLKVYDLTWEIGSGNAILPFSA